MTRDYKNSSRPAPKRSTPPRTSASGGNVWKGMLIGLFVGVAAAVGVALFVNRNNNPFTEPKAAGKAAEPAKADKKHAAAPALEALKPGAGTKQPPAPAVQSYDFYKILPGTEEPGMAAPAQPVPPAKPVEEKPASAPPAWFQVGAFQNESDADNLKAKLALIGVEASIQTTNLPDKGVWHRVRVGPLKAPDDIDKMRQTLRQNGIEANLIQPKAAAGKPVVAAKPAAAHAATAVQ